MREFNLFIPLAIILCYSCTHSTNLDNKNEDQLVDIQEDTIKTVSPSNTFQDTISCLDIPFIEQLESSWNSAYKDPKLAKKGFSRSSINTIENGKGIVFKNTRTESKITIAKTKHPDGETSFTVNYLFQPLQLDCIKKQLNQSSYKLDTRNRAKTDRYLKKGLGTYEEKRIEIDTIKLTLFYTHTRGKELSSPEINFETE